MNKAQGQTPSTPNGNPLRAERLPYQQRKQRSGRGFWIAVLMLALLVLGGIAYLQYGRQPVVQQNAQATVAPASEALPESAASTNAPPADTVALPNAEDTAAALPAISDSDRSLQAALESLFGASLHDWLWPDHIIRRIVATIDSLDGEAVPPRLRPLRNVDGAFVVDAAPDGGITISPENARRYAPYVDMLNKVDARRVADFYFHYQPLFQKAHEELGYAGQSFNDRLLQVIDHLLATPAVTPPVKLIRPNVLYQYDDAHIERLSYGQKILVRMGGDNAAIVKAKLREIRKALTAPR